MELILRNQPIMERTDFFTWKFNKSGQMTVKSAYWLASSQKSSNNFPEIFMEPSINVLKERVWKVKTLPKIRVFLWKSLSAALPTADLLSTRGMKVDNRCQKCGREADLINHLLFYAVLHDKCGWFLRFRTVGVVLTDLPFMLTLTIF